LSPSIRHGNRAARTASKKVNGMSPLTPTPSPTVGRGEKERPPASPTVGRGEKADFAGAVVVLMAGGAGVRFWPLSTPDRPKQFLTELAGRSLYAQAAERARMLVPPERIMVATSGNLAPLARRQSPEIPRRNLLVEPMRRDTAAALIYAALVVERRWPGSVMIATPSDHFVGDTAAFRRTMAAAVARARLGGLGTIGIPPTFASTEYGYLRIAGPVRGGRAAAVRQFVEKPGRRTAARYIASGRYLWNAGMFIWRTDVFLAAAERHLPDTHHALAGLVGSMGAGGRGSSGAAYAARARRAFRRLRPISIDYGIMEKTDDVWCVPGRMDWSDVGNWLAIEKVIAADARGNRTRGEVFLEETDRTIVVGRPGHPIVVAGVADCIVVDTPCGTLVCGKGQSSRLKSVINRALVTEPRT